MHKPKNVKDFEMKEDDPRSNYNCSLTLIDIMRVNGVILSIGRLFNFTRYINVCNVTTPRTQFTPELDPDLFFFSHLQKHAGQWIGDTKTALRCD